MSADFRAVLFLRATVGRLHAIMSAADSPVTPAMIRPKARNSLSAGFFCSIVLNGREEEGEDGSPGPPEDCQDVKQTSWPRSTSPEAIFRILRVPPSMSLRGLWFTRAIVDNFDFTFPN